VKYFTRNCAVLAFIFVAVFGVVAATAQDSFINFENPHCNPIAMSPDGTTLATCNTAANRVDFWSLASGTPVFTKAVPVGYDPVTVRWRTDSELWVVNHISDSISIIDSTNFIVSTTVDTLDEPCDVVFAGSTERAFVSCSSVNTIQVFNPTTFAETGTVEVAAEDPRGLSVSADGTKVYAAIFESGNGTTLIFGAGVAGGGFPPTSAMFDVTNPYRGQNPPPNVDVAGFNTNTIDWGTDWSAEMVNYFSPTPIDAGTIATRAPVISHIVQFDGVSAWLDDNGEDWTPWISGAKSALSGRPAGWTLVDRDVAIIDANNPTGVAVEYVERLMNHNMAIGVNPVTEDITVVGTDATNVIRFEPNLTGTFTRVNLAVVDPALPGSPTIVDLNEAHLSAAQFAQDGISDAYHDESVPQADRDDSIGDPRAIVWNAAGTRGYVAGMGSDNIIIVDTSGVRSTIGYTVDVGQGPTGIALDESRNQLYTMNRFNGSISVLDITTPGSESVSSTIPFFDPTPSAVKTGRVHFYGTHENSGLGQIACASCHIDGRKDRLAWDLGDPSGGIKALDLIATSADLTPKHNPAFLPATLDDFHPMKGPMTTQTLQDIIGKEPHHWRGDRDGIEEFGDAFVGLQGRDAILDGTPMQEFEDFLETMHFPPNPFRDLDNSLPTDLPLPRQFSDGRFSGGGGLSEGDPMPNGNAQTGLTIYRRTSMDGSAACITCHTLPLGNSPELFLDTSIVTHVIPPGPNGEAKLALFDDDGSDQRTFKIPQTRAIFDKAGFEMTPGNESLAGFGVFHDGGIDSITRFVSEVVFTGMVDDQEIADMVALMFSFSGSFDTTALSGEFPINQISKDAHAAVGKQTTLDSASKDLTLLNELKAIADTSDFFIPANFEIDLIAKTTQSVAWLGNVVRSWKYDASSGLYLPDQANQAGITQAALLALAASGSEITFSAVPFGSGDRLGLDRDEDGLYDFDEIRDLDITSGGVQNPFDPDDADSTGDDGQDTGDGIPDGQNDYDNDGGDNDIEFASPTGTPFGAGLGLPAIQDWGLVITILLMASALLGTAGLLRRRAS